MLYARPIGSKPKAPVEAAVPPNGAGPTPDPITNPLEAVGNELPELLTASSVVVELPAAKVDRKEKVLLDEFEKLAANCILDEDDGDIPGSPDEIQVYPVEKKLPRFANFRANPDMIFEMWGTSDQQGMDSLVYAVTKNFAPEFEDDVELRRIRFYETVTQDGIVRLIYCFVPETGNRRPNLWITTKDAALKHALTQWTTMRSRTDVQQYTYRPSKQDYGEPKFSGLTKVQWIQQLQQQGVLIVDKTHPFYKKATDTLD